MLKIYGTPNNRASRILWMALELDCPFELISIDPRKGEHLTPEYWQINPFGKVPAIQYQGVTMAESAAILTWLCDRFPEKQLIPAAGTDARASHEQWMYFIMTEIEAHLWTITRNSMVLPEAQRVPAILPQAFHWFEQSVRILGAHLEAKPYLNGKSFQCVDLLCAAVLGWAISLKAPGLSPGLLSYHTKMKERAAYLAFKQRYLKPAQS